MSRKSSAHAVVGFRVKSGWAMAVLLTGSVNSPQVRDRRRIELSDPAVPETIQPHHAGMGRLQTDEARVTKLQKVIRHAANESVTRLTKEYRGAGYPLGAAGLVVGSDIDPERISNPHIRAHALEGRLFRSALEDALKTCGLPCSVLVARDLYARAAEILKQSESELKRRLVELGRALGGPWRAEEKTACLAAWLGLAIT